MQKTIKQVFVSGATLAIAFVFLWGIMVAWAAWSEPSQSPPNGNVAAPINSGDLDQVKTGRISARDVWSSDSGGAGGEWMSELLKLKLLPVPVRLINILGVTQQNSSPNVTVPLSSYGTGIPLGRIKALQVRAHCNQIALYAKSTSPDISDASVDRLCGAADDQSDSNDAIIKVSPSGFQYRQVNTGGSGTYSLFLDIIAVWYY